MFEIDMEMLKEQGLQFVDTAKKAAQGLADKGKNQLELLNQQARLSKAQRQLGALVYSLHKAGEENQPLVDKYIAAVAEVEKAIEDIKAAMTPEERAEAEAQEATDAEEPVVSEDGEESEEEIEEEVKSLAKQYELEEAKVKEMVPAEELTGSLVTRKAIKLIVDSAVAVTPKAEEKTEA